MITLTTKNKIAVKIRRTEKPGSLKAHADLRLTFPDGELHVIGFGIIEQPGKKPYVGFPQNRGHDKYFPVFVAKGDLREEIVKEILRAYEHSSERQ